METLAKRASNILRNLVWHLDYLIHLLNPLRFKPIPHNIKNILIIELLFIGDVIVTTPAIRALKKNFPEANIDVMLLPGIGGVLSGNPNISRILAFSKEEIKKQPHVVAGVLKKNNYDLAVVLHPGSYAVSRVLFMAGIPFRIGCTRVGFLEGKGFLFHRNTKPTFRWKHKIEDNLDVIKTIGLYSEDKKLEIYTTEESESRLEQFLAENKIKEYFVIHPGANQRTYEWFPERYAELADKLIGKYDIPVIFTGGKNNTDLINNISSLMKNKSYSLADRSIKDLFSAIKHAKFTVTVDTSASHVSAAFSKPTVTLFGVGVPKVWHPYCDNYQVVFKGEVCTSCLRYNCKKDLECMRSITVNDVLEAVEKVI